MNKYSHSFFIVLMVFFCSGLSGRVSGQGIRNDGATINIASGYVVSPEGLGNNSGTIINNGTLIIAGGIINAGTVSGDGDYYTGGDWANDGVFTPGESTVTFNGTDAQYIEGSSITTFNNLTINTTGTPGATTIAAGSRVTVSGTFSPNGKLIINSDAVSNSGSLIYEGTGIPSGNVTYNRLMPAGELYHYISSPVSSETLPSGTTFWRWNEPLGVWGEDAEETPTEDCESGMGYTILTAGSTVSFTGSVLNELLDVVTTAPYMDDCYENDRGTWGGGGWNLLGNPFTCTLDGSAFITANTSSLDINYQAMYIYDGDNYTYIAEEIPGYPTAYTGEGLFSGNEVQAGQGFFVLAHHDGAEFDFTSGMKTHNTSVVMTKSASTEEAWPGLQLKAKYGERESSTLIVYNDQMTDGLDPGYDVGFLSSDADVEIYTLLAAGGNDFNFTRQVLPEAGAETTVIPLGVDSKQGGEVVFSALIVPLGINRFWLEDRLTGTYTDLNTGTYSVTLPEKTFGTGRFFVHASANMPEGTDQLTADPDALDLRVWTAFDQFIIKGAVSDRAICAIYDTRGNKIMEACLTGGELNTVSAPSSGRGVFLVKVIDGLKVSTHKVVMF